MNKTFKIEDVGKITQGDNQNEKTRINHNLKEDG